MRRFAPLALLVACTGAAEPSLQRPSPELRPELFFAGETRGEGKLEIALRRDRTLTVESRGTPVGPGALRIDQVIRYGDGEVNRRSWTLTRASDGGYTAVLTEAKGPVRVTQRGNAVNIRYRFGSPTVSMDQWLYLRPDGRTVDNRATVRLAGVAVAKLRETITKEAGVAKAP